MTVRNPSKRLCKMSWSNTLLLSTICLLSMLLHHPVQAHPPPPQANDIFGTVNGCASALVEMDDNQDGMIKKNEYLDFVNLLADFLCIPPRPILDLEIQTVFFSIACLCQEREGFDMECCFGTDAAIWTAGASDAITRTEDQDSYLRAACLLTQAILGPQQCTLAPATLSPEAIVQVGPLIPVQSSGGLSDEEMWAIIIGAILLALLCCLLLCCAFKKKDEEEEEVVIIKEEQIEQGEVGVDDVKPLVPVQAEPPQEPPMQEAHSTPIIPPVVPPPPAVREEEDDYSESENIGKKMGVTIDDDEEDENNRRFGGQGMLPLPPEPEGVLLRHVEVEKEAPGEYEYPERELHEYQRPPDEDSVQEFEPYIPDGGVYDPQRPPKAPVIFGAPNYQRQQRVDPEPYDPRKFRQQLAMGDGEVWESLAAHEEERAQTKENKFEWIVQGALDVLARAHESGELTKPRPKTPDPKALPPPPQSGAAASATPSAKQPLQEIFPV